MNQWLDNGQRPAKVHIDDEDTLKLEETETVIYSVDMKVGPEHKFDTLLDLWDLMFWKD